MWVFLFSPHEHTCLHDWNLSKFCSGDARWAMNKHASPSEDNSSFYFASLHSIDRLAVHHWQAISQCRQCNRRQLLLDGKSEWVCSFISLSPSLSLPTGRVTFHDEENFIQFCFCKLVEENKIPYQTFWFRLILNCHLPYRVSKERLTAR